MARIETIRPTDPRARRLLDQSDAYMTALYPPESNHLESAADLSRPNVAFFGCIVDAELVGCIALKVMEDDGQYGEIKRLFVREGHRGKRLSSALMLKIEEHAREQGLRVLRAEVGVRQPEALGLYAGMGFRERPPFGQYEADPLGVYLEKWLDPD